MLKPGFVACPLDQNAAHRLRGCAEKMRAVLPRSVAVVHQPQPGLMHQGRRLKRLAGHFMRHSRGRQAPQFGIYQRQQLFGRAFFAATNRMQDLRDFSSFRHGFLHYTPATTEIQAKPGGGRTALWRTLGAFGALRDEWTHVFDLWK